jgi:hypothetical protein
MLLNSWTQGKLFVKLNKKFLSNVVDNICLYKRDQQLRKLVEESKLIEKLLNTSDYEKKMLEIIERLRIIIEKNKQNLVNIFRMDSKESSGDIEMSILRTFLNSKLNKNFHKLTYTIF